MRPSPSLHYVSTLLDQRRKRHHRARRLWGAGLGLLGCGLLLVGWWVTLRFPPQSTPPAGVMPPVVVPAPSSGATGTPVLPREPLWGRPVLLEPGAPQDHPCQTRPPWRVACTPVDVFAIEFSPLPLQAVGALAVYAVDTLVMNRMRSWNYRRISLADGTLDGGAQVPTRGDCRMLIRHGNTQ